MNVFRASTRILPTAVIALSLTGCDPGIYVAFQKDFKSRVDPACVKQALRSVAPDVQQTTYQSGSYETRGFSPNTTVFQFNYTGSALDYYSLDIAAQSNGLTHYWHGWSKIGTKVPIAEQRRLLPLLIRANDAVGRQCGLSFSGTRPMIGDG